MSKEKSYVLKKITPNLIYKSLKASHDLMEYYQQTGKNSLFEIYESIRANKSGYDLLREIVVKEDLNNARTKATERLICELFGNSSPLYAYSNLLQEVFEHVKNNYGDVLEEISTEPEECLNYYLDEILVSDVFFETLQDLDYDADYNPTEREMKKVNAQFKRNLKYKVNNLF